MKEITLSVKIKLTPDQLEDADDIAQVVQDALDGEFPEFEDIIVEKTNEIDVPTAD